MRKFWIIGILIALIYNCKEKETVDFTCHQLYNSQNELYFNLKDTLGFSKLNQFIGNDSINFEKMPFAHDSLNQWKSFKNNDLELVYSDTCIEIVRFYNNHYAISGMDIGIGNTLDEIEKIYILEKVNNDQRIFQGKGRKKDFICGNNIYLKFDSDTLSEYSIYMQ